MVKFCLQLGCSGRVSSSCSTSDTRRVNLVTNPLISHERGNDREVFTTSETYPWSFVTQIFHSGQPSHGGDAITYQLRYIYIAFTGVAGMLLHLYILLESSFRKFCGCPHNLIDRYGISLSQMTTDMFHLSYALPGPFLMHDLSPAL
jgi:hypothetical protein